MLISQSLSMQAVIDPSLTDVLTDALMVYFFAYSGILTAREKLSFTSVTEISSLPLFI